MKRIFVPLFLTLLIATGISITLDKDYLAYDEHMPPLISKKLVFTSQKTDLEKVAYDDLPLPHTVSPIC